MYWKDKQISIIIIKVALLLFLFFIIELKPGD